MLSHVRNGEAGRLRDVHALGNEELVSYGLAHHIVIADKRNELATELAGRELLRQHHPDVVVSQDAGNADDRTLARARLCVGRAPVRPTHRMAQMLHIKPVGTEDKKSIYSASALYSSMKVVDANTKAPRIGLSEEFQADELVGSVILSLAQELVAIANGCALNEVPFEVAEYEKDWRKCMQADRLEVAKATQPLNRQTPEKHRLELP